MLFSGMQPFSFLSTNGMVDMTQIVSKDYSAERNKHLARMAARRCRYIKIKNYCAYFVKAQ